MSAAFRDLQGRQRKPSALGQWSSLVKKNLVLQTRARKSWLGLEGYGALALQIIIPSLFFLLCCIPKRYIKPIPHGQQLTPQTIDLDTKWWSGPNPYSGPAMQNNTAGEFPAHLVLVPDTPAVQALAQVLARTLACPPNPAKRHCLPGMTPSLFHCMFLKQSAPPQCEDMASCMADTACWGHLLVPSPGAPAQLALAADEEAGMKLALARPPIIDAVLVFGDDAGSSSSNHDDGVAGGGGGAQSFSSGRWLLKEGTVDRLLSNTSSSGAGDSKRDTYTQAAVASHGLGYSAAANLSLQLTQLKIRMNHTDVPPTQFLLDAFDVQPSRINGLSLYRRHWFFANLQFAVQRAVLGMRRAELAAGGGGGPQQQLGWESAGSLDEGRGIAAADPVIMHGRTEGTRHSSTGTDSSEDAMGLGLPPGLYDTAAPVQFSLGFKPFPWPAVTEDLGAASAAAFFNLLLVYAFLAPARAVVGGIVREKELRLREGMRVMGLGEAGYWGSWFVTHWLTLSASGVLCAIIGMYPFEHTSISVMLTFFALFTAAIICFSYFLSTLFSTSRVAGTTAQLCYAAAMIPGFIIPTAQPYGGLSWYLVCLLPPSAASLFATCLINWEIVSVGINWHTLFLPVAQDSGFSAFTVLLLLAVDVVLYSALAWYCDKVLPTGLGQRLPPTFFLQRKYWSARRKHHGSTGHGSASDLVQGLLEQDGGEAAGGILVRGLVKEFPKTGGGTVRAVDHVTCSMAPGRTTALLGHNGAGKTTLIHLLTGMLQPTGGSATISGLDVATQMAAIRGNLGICPQFDLLWPELSVREHLELYAALKGYRGKDVKQVVQQAAQEVGLEEKINAFAGDLSGGQRRKLSVALAMLGDPSVLLIDEPTSGMDPYSRRFTWELVRKRRGTACVLLTTHSMEEADALADDIIIMASGTVAATGTPLELKAQYGEGYILTAVLLPSASATRTASTASQGSTARGDQYQQGTAAAAGLETAASLQGGDKSISASAADAVGSVVARHVPGAVRLGLSGSEVRYRLPMADVPSFPALLRDLDAITLPGDHTPSDAASGTGRGHTPVSRTPSGTTPPPPQAVPGGQYSISSYGISATTLEEVFLRVTQAAASATSAAMSDKQQPVVTQSHTGSVAMLSQDSHSVSLVEYQNSANSKQAPPKQAHTAAGPSQTQGSGTLLPSEQEAISSGHVPRLTGLALIRQQLRALLVKRALCASRDRLALLTQSGNERPLVLSRSTALMGAPSVLAANASVRDEAGNLAAWGAAFPARLVDSGVNDTWQGGQTAGTLEGYLLGSWHSGSPAYDALLLTSLPSPQQILSAVDPAAPAGPLAAGTLLVNQTAVHGLPAALSSICTALLRYMEAGASAQATVTGAAGMTSSTGGWGQAYMTATNVTRHHEPEDHRPQFVAVNHPLPTLPVEPVYRIKQDAAGLMLVVCLTLASSVLSASFAVFLVRERAGNSKHVQLVSGARPWLFWLSTYAFDLASYALSGAGIIILVAVYRLPQYQGTRLLAVACLLGMFGISSLPLTYVLQGLFMDEMLALQRLNTAYFLVGYLGFVATWVIDLILIFTQPATLKAANAWVKFLFRTASPHFCFAKGVYDVGQTFKSDIPLPIKRETNPWAWSVTGSPLAHMASQAVIYLAVAILLDTRLGAHTTLMLRGLLARLTCSKNHRPAPGSGQTPAPTRAAGPNRDVESGQAVTQPLMLHRDGANGVQGVHEEGEEGVDVDVQAEREAVQAEGPGPHHTVVVDGITKTFVQGARVVALAHQLLRRNKHRRQQQGQQASQLHPVSQSAQSAQSGQQQQQGGASSAVWAPHHASTGGAPEGAAGTGNIAGTGNDGNSSSSSQLVRAVRGMWFRVSPGECFGLLGVNGAGKTTTQRIITGEELPDAGDAYVCGRSVTRQQVEARQRMGYCPQFEALLGAMTATEVLTMYARLRGVPEHYIPGMVTHLIQRVGLVKYAHVACGTLSGGNKRKLALAAALVGDPPVALLDEPSTGMDPGSRRGMWDLLQGEVQGAGRSIVLTSHSMEECEALCNRLVIMVAGKAACIGSPQHLRSRFGGGYVVDARVEAREGQELEAAVGAVEQVLRDRVTPSVIRTMWDVGSAHVTWSLPGHFSLARLFEVLLELKQQAGDVSGAARQQEQGSTSAAHPGRLLTFSVAQTSLEHVFVRLCGAAAAAAAGAGHADG